MDPLTALREYTIKNQLEQITRVDNEYRFSTEFTFPASTETAYRSKHSQYHHRYTLKTLFHFITNHHLKHTDYMQLARSHKIPAITLPDRKPLVDYLTGKNSTSDSIDPFPTTTITLENNPLNAPHPALADPIEMIRVNERPLRDREAILECISRDFYSVLNREVAKREEVKDLGEDEKPKMMFKTGKVGEGVPIIFVPSAYSTLITIYNVKEFLENGVFIPTEVKVKQMKGVKPDCVTVQKKFSRDRVVTAYEVRDKPSSLKSDDWDRVVAVFVLGKEWQFKDWPFKDHVQIFNKIFGFYLRFEDDSVESARVAKQWNVKIISISKNKRHQDRAAALEVWDRLEEFMRSRSR